MLVGEKHILIELSLILVSTVTDCATDSLGT
jgi:hypothetical protein